MLLSNANPAYNPQRYYSTTLGRFVDTAAVPARIANLPGRVAGGLGTAGRAIGRKVGPHLPGAAKGAIGSAALIKLLGDLQKIPIPYVKEPWGASYGRIDNPLE